MKNALIIEDDENNTVLISALLQKSGYQTMHSWNGEEGLRRAAEEKPDFIILDIQLPGIDGYEVLRRLRVSQENSTTQVIAMTSYAMSGDRERLLKAGCNGYIEKPIDPARVIAQIHEVTGENP